MESLYHTRGDMGGEGGGWGAGGVEEERCVDDGMVRAQEVGG